MSLKELQLPSIASLRAIAALKSPHLALVRPARIGLGFESAGANQKTLAEVEELLGGPGRLQLTYSLRWLLDVMTGLGVLHRTLSFVHGEVQPEHLVLGDDGVGRLVPVVRAHWVRGEQRAPERLYYLAPEKLLGDRVDVRSDVFSVGVLLWEALAGRRLLDAHDVDDIIARLMGGGIPRARAPEVESWSRPLGEIAERAIAVDPGRRFANVAEMKDAMQAVCGRYLASPPGMAEVFQNPSQRARARSHDSKPPESQRATVPPAQQPGPTWPPPTGGAHQAALAAEATRVARGRLTSVDLEDEETTAKPRSSTKPPVNQPKHIQTLLGVPPPFIDRESSPDDITQPFAKIPASSPVLITPLPQAGAPAQVAARPQKPTAATTATARPVARPLKPVVATTASAPTSDTPTVAKAVQPGRRQTLSGPPPKLDRPDTAPPPSVAAPPPSPRPVVASAPPPAVAPTQPAWPPAPSAPPLAGTPPLQWPAMAAPPAATPAESQRAVSFSPRAAPPIEPAPLPAFEPSFELMRPRKRRGVLWLLLAAALAAGAFAAGPWLARQVAAASDSLPDNAATNAESASTTPTAAATPSPAPPPSGTAADSSPPSAERTPIGIASTPAVPSAATPPRGHGGGREEHVVIHDRVEPPSEPAAPVAVEHKPEPPPAAPPTPPATPPAAPPASAPKAKVPVSDADRYGI